MGIPIQDGVAGEGEYRIPPPNSIIGA